MRWAGASNSFWVKNPHPSEEPGTPTSGSAMVQSYLHDRAEFVGLLDVQLQTHISLVVLSLMEEAGRGPRRGLGLLRF
jgi:hypothetical protein